MEESDEPVRALSRLTLIPYQDGSGCEAIHTAEVESIKQLIEDNEDSASSAPSALSKISEELDHRSISSPSRATTYSSVMGEESGREILRKSNIRRMRMERRRNREEDEERKRGLSLTPASQASTVPSLPSVYQPPPDLEYDGERVLPPVKPNTGAFWYQPQHEQDPEWRNHRMLHQCNERRLDQLDILLAEKSTALGCAFMDELARYVHTCAQDCEYSMDMEWSYENDKVTNMYRYA